MLTLSGLRLIWERNHDRQRRRNENKNETKSEKLS
jgi:hypothetical protein